VFDFFGWDVGMSGYALLVLFAGAIVIGTIPQFIGRSTYAPVEWAVTSIAALVGGWLGSESVGTFSTWGWSFEGLYIVPALIGGVLLAAIVDVTFRLLTGGTYVHEPRPV
jgi:uncharacterized membrane protein YeaQ/YmgE (transglycosylase-associated protein family)